MSNSTAEWSGALAPSLVGSGYASAVPWDAIGHLRDTLQQLGLALVSWNPAVNETYLKRRSPTQ